MFFLLAQQRQHFFMPKFLYFGHHYTNQTANIFATSNPTQPAISRHAGAESCVFDPSSCLPKGQCYPIPSFFEYRAKPKEQYLRQLTLQVPFIIKHCPFKAQHFLLYGIFVEQLPHAQAAWRFIVRFSLSCKKIHLHKPMIFILQLNCLGTTKILEPQLPNG